MASEVEGGGSRKRARAQPELRRVPWQSWREWRALRSALFSDHPARVSAALNRIAVWQSRGDVPVAVEVTGKIIAVHQRDAEFRAGLPAHLALPEEMLQMMYAMTTMRLVNGIVDQAHRRNSASVATRAEKVGLPRVLVDIRHESAHMELPAISLLRDGSKEMLAWLESHYWSFQEQKLQDVRTQLKLKLMDYVQALQLTSVSAKSCPPTPDEREEQDHLDRKELKKTKKALKRQQNLQLDQVMELCSSARSDLVSIIVDDGLTGQLRVAEEKNQSHGPLLSTNDSGPHQRDTISIPQHDQLAEPAAAVWKYAIRKLSSHIPELPLMLLTRIIDRLCEDRAHGGESALEKQTTAFEIQLHTLEPSAAESKFLSSSSSVVSGLLDWGAWLLGEKVSPRNSELPPLKARKGDNGRSPSEGPPLVGGLFDGALKELLFKCLRKIGTNKQLERLVPLLAIQVGDRRLLQRAVVLAKLGAIGLITDPERNFTGQDKNGELPGTDIKDSDQVMSKIPTQRTRGQAVLLMRSVAGCEPAQGSERLIETREFKAPAPQPDGEVTLAEAREQQESLIRKVLNLKAAAIRKGSGAAESGAVPTGSSGRWTKVQRWRPCPIGTILRGRRIEESNFDSDCERNLEGGSLANRVGDRLVSSLPQNVDRDVAPPSTPGDEDPPRATSSPADEMVERAVLLSPFKPSAVDDGAQKTSGDNRPRLEATAAQRVEEGPFSSLDQQARPLKGCLLLNGTYQPCGEELLAVLRASVHVL